MGVDLGRGCNSGNSRGKEGAKEYKGSVERGLEVDAVGPADGVGFALALEVDDGAGVADDAEHCRWID